MKTSCVIVFSLFFLEALFGQEQSPQVLAKAVADKLVAGTDFSFIPAYEEADQDGSYALDFYDSFGYYPSAMYAARTVIDWKTTAGQQPRLLLGWSSSAGEMEILLNGRPLALRHSTDDKRFNHVDYGLFEYQNYVLLELRPGPNSLGFRYTPSGERAKVVLGFLRSDNGLPHPGIELRSPLEVEKGHPFIVLGPCSPDVPSNSIFDMPDDRSLLLMSVNGLRGGKIGWDIPRMHLVHAFPGALALQDWRYFTGTFLDALGVVSKRFPSLDYVDYIDRHIDFFLSHRELIGDQRNRYGLRESPFGHYFRFSLLDDMGMQAVPLVERLRRFAAQGILKGNAKVSVEWSLVERVANHIMREATRLPDGTFARLTPDTLTVWADDLFMGTVFLVRFSTLLQDTTLLNEAVRQVILFDHHLRDSKTNLYWHGWFSRTSVPSSSKWGRANGWVMMAKTELLLNLPPTHKQRDQIIKTFREHAEGLLKYQSSDGRWHQVLDNANTYLETSATAMFVRSFAIGVMKGWLPKEEFHEAILRGWQGLSSQIKADGTIEGIVRGTPIMYSDAEYNAHPPRTSDPRGLGAILYALTAMDDYFSTVH